MRPLFSLDKRLMLCAELVRKNSRMADIGTDHAYLPVWLARAGIVSFAIAADIKAEPLKSGMQTIEKYHAEDLVTTRLCDGLEGIGKGEVDDVVIAGMGGETIVHILGNAPWIKDRGIHLILQPMSKHEVVISYLYENGFELKSHRTCTADGKVYTAFLAEYTGCTQSCSELFSYTGLLNPEVESDRLFLLSVINHLDKKAKGDQKFEKISNQIKERFCI